MTRILTGLRANGIFHLGNYLGSMQPMAQLQADLNSDDTLNMFIADLHSFTTPIDHSSFNQQIVDNVRMYIAAGIDPTQENTLLYRQSQVSAHSELAWILANFTNVGELNRMVEFKDKSKRLEGHGVTSGLYMYPVLMVADILLYDAKYIPLGDDQKQHLELTRTVSERFNKRFETSLFTTPAAWEKQLAFAHRLKGVRIRSLVDPVSKMSKSIADPKGTIDLTDSPDEAFKKIMSAETDSVGRIQKDEQSQPGITNLLLILELLGASPDEWIGLEQYGPFKKVVATTVADFLTSFQTKLKAIDNEQAEDHLAKGEAAASEIANKKLREVQKVLGL